MITNPFGSLHAPWDINVEHEASTWDMQQRVRILGAINVTTASVTVRSLASRATLYVQLHIQSSAAGEGGATYDVSNYKSTARVDVRSARQTDHTVAREVDEWTYVWIVPVFEETDGSFLKYDGADGDDQMAFIEFPPDAGTVNVETITSTDTLDAGNDVVWADATSAAFTLTLPAAATMVGKQFDIKKIDSTANAVTVDANGAETIDGATTAVLASQWDAIRIVTDGTSWGIQ